MTIPPAAVIALRDLSAEIRFVSGAVDAGQGEDQSVLRDGLARWATRLDALIARVEPQTLSEPSWTCAPCEQGLAFERASYHDSCTSPDCSCARNGHRGWFHWANGWFFRRLPNGDVDIQRRESSHEGAAVIVAQRIPGAEWRSIVEFTTARVEPPPQEHGWQPIETAPKDGTEIIALVSGRPYFVSWTTHGTQHAEPWWRDREGYGLTEPTHWIPLPVLAAPPSPPPQEPT